MSKGVMKATTAGFPNYKDTIEEYEPSENVIIWGCNYPECKLKAVVFDINKENQCITVVSALRRYTLVLDFETVYKLIENKDMMGLHMYFRSEYSNLSGLDNYCPKCNKIYCHEHWIIMPIFELGFYDYTLGSCPRRHERILDD